MKKGILIPLVALLVLFIATPVLAAPATKTPFTAAGSFVPGGVDPGMMWITEDGIQHVKGITSEGTISGDISGDVLIIEDEVLDLNTGEGSGHGKWILTVDGGGTFEGSHRAEMTGFTHFSGTAVGHGTDVYEGQKMKFSFEGDVTLDEFGVPILGEVDMEGIILSPKG